MEKQRCPRCNKVLTDAEKPYPWCRRCFKEDPDQARKVYARTRRAKRTALLSGLEKHSPVVYAVDLGDGRVKVGTTNSLKRTLQQYRRIVPHAEAFWTASGSRITEQSFHERLGKYRIGKSEVFLLGDAESAWDKLQAAEDELRVKPAWSGTMLAQQLRDFQPKPKETRIGHCAIPGCTGTWVIDSGANGQRRYCSGPCRKEAKRWRPY